MMDYSVSDGTGLLGIAQVNANSPLGRGATAVIYPAMFSGVQYAAKIYHSDRTVDKAKILAMLANAPANVRIQVAGGEHPQLAWPFGFLTDKSNTIVGYLMPMVDLSKAYSLEYFYDQTLTKKLKSPSEAALSFKLEIARNLTLLVADLHDHGHHFIDLKPQNIRVLLGSHVVTLVDCDGFSIAGPDGHRFPAELVSSDYVAPEAYRSSAKPATLGEPQDRYALAVILFQLLNRGTHPFQGVIAASNVSASTNDEKAALGLYPHGLKPDSRIVPRKQSIHFLLDDKLRNLFDAAFTGAPDSRPSARDWANCLDSILRNKGLARCDTEPFDLTHIRFAAKDCPTCYLLNLSPIISKKTTISSQYLPRSGAQVNYAPLPVTNAPIQKRKAGNNKTFVFWILAALALLLVLFNTPGLNTRSAPSKFAGYSDTDLCAAYYEPSQQMNQDQREILIQVTIRGYRSFDEMCPPARSSIPNAQPEVLASPMPESMSQVLNRLYRNSDSQEVDARSSGTSDFYSGKSLLTSAMSSAFRLSDDATATVTFSGVSIAPFQAIRLRSCGDVNQVTGVCFSTAGNVVCDREFFALIAPGDSACIDSFVK